MKLRALMATIALLAVLLGIGLGLRRRSDRFQRVSLGYSSKAAGLEEPLGFIPGRPEPTGVQAVLDRVHWNDSVAAAYQQAASRPWVPGEPDPAKITCQCGYHAKPATARPAP